MDRLAHLRLVHRPAITPIAVINRVPRLSKDCRDIAAPCVPAVLSRGLLPANSGSSIENRKAQHSRVFLLPETALLYAWPDGTSQTNPRRYSRQAEQRRPRQAGCGAQVCSRDRRSYLRAQRPAAPPYTAEYPWKTARPTRSGAAALFEAPWLLYFRGRRKVVDANARPVWQQHSDESARCHRPASPPPWMSDR